MSFQSIDAHYVPTYPMGAPEAMASCMLAGEVWCVLSSFVGTLKTDTMEISSDISFKIGGIWILAICKLMEIKLVVIAHAAYHAHLR